MTTGASPVAVAYDSSGSMTSRRSACRCWAYRLTDMTTIRAGLAESGDRHRVSPRKAVIKLLRAVHLNRVLARIYYRSFHGFASVGRELPDVVGKCLHRAMEAQTTQQGDYYEFGVFK